MFEAEIEATQLVEDEPEMTSAQPIESQLVTSPSTAAPINTEIDYLPPREGRRFMSQVPEPTAPKGVRGWSMDMLQAAIEHCNLPGVWRQGGQLHRGVFGGLSAHGHFVINWQSGTWWCQGKAAQQVHMQLLASEEARRHGARDA